MPCEERQTVSGEVGNPLKSMLFHECLQLLTQWPDAVITELHEARAQLNRIAAQEDDIVDVEPIRNKQLPSDTDEL